VTNPPGRYLGIAVNAFSRSDDCLTENDSERHPQGARGRLHHLPLRDVGRVLRVPDDRDSSQLRDGLFQELHAFSAELGKAEGEPRHVSARLREILDEARADRIAHRDHHDRNSLRRVLRRQRRLKAGGSNEVDVELDELGRHILEELEVPSG
jgi:hypothetical protein